MQEAGRKGKAVSGWAIMNWLAWAGCAVFAILLAVDFVRVERRRKGSDDEPREGP